MLLEKSALANRQKNSPKNLRRNKDHDTLERTSLVEQSDDNTHDSPQSPAKLRGFFRVS